MAVATPERPTVVEHPLRPAVRPHRASVLRARPIPVMAYPPGVPRWVTYEGRRRRVLSVQDQPVHDASELPVARGSRRLRVELAGGRALTLVHDGSAWFER